VFIQKEYDLLLNAGDLDAMWGCLIELCDWWFYCCRKGLAFSHSCFAPPYFQNLWHIKTRFALL